MGSSPGFLCLTHYLKCYADPKHKENVRRKKPLNIIVHGYFFHLLVLQHGIFKIFKNKIYDQFFLNLISQYGQRFLLQPLLNISFLVVTLQLS